ncbi:RND transporter [Veronia nyctiphanis]|uniref:RND transporter n=1 Tax=Veronia nyctiphanis TaxID=1278244 RepID=A0A4Q0YNG8_9GAMM|nr:HlyD family efflux transporter periplasmic adaptor subunit [Veronia nyctiphanis]RXJ70839.1 RND transporter [Veronia nyctiphanis]
MDIKIEKKGKSYKRVIALSTAFALLISGVVAGRSYLGESSNMADGSELRRAIVEQGQFDIKVRASGKLVIDYQRLITANTDGKVTEILVKPGEIVEAEQAIVRLENPETRERLAQKQSLLTRRLAEHEAELAGMDAGLVDLEAARDNALLDVKNDKKMLSSYQHLLAKGYISKLEFNKKQLALAKHQNNLSVQIARVEKHIKQVDAVKRAQLAEVKGLNLDIETLIAKINDLTVRSSMSGQIQEISIGLGMQISSNSTIAKVADHTQLIARLEVAELEAPFIQVTQPATIDTFSSEIKGTVSRVSPIVTNGQVEVDIVLSGELPNEARNQLNVQGVIKTLERDNALYVKIPANSQQNQLNSVFVVNGNKASKTKVRFGLRSVNHIEVADGLSVGDEIIISDTSEYALDKQILLYN